MTTETDVQQSISDIVEHIIVRYQPKKIILFGSYAYGHPHEDSDIDLLIIKDTLERPIDRRIAIRRIVYDPQRRIPFSPLVLTPTELDKQLKLGDDFIKDIVTHGKTLYE